MDITLTEKEKENLEELISQFTATEVRKGVKITFKCANGLGVTKKVKIGKHKKVDITDYSSW